MSRGDLLFNKYDLRSGLESQRLKAAQRVLSLSANEVRLEAEDTLLARLLEEYQGNPLELQEADITVEQEDVEVDVSHERSRIFRPGTRPVVPGLRVRYYLPYTGDKALWEARPSTYTLNPPAATEVTDTEVIFAIDVAGTNIEQTKREFDEQLRRIREWLVHSRNDVEQHNKALMPVLQSNLEKRREDIAKAQAGLQALGLRVRPKGAPAPTPAPDLVSIRRRREVSKARPPIKPLRGGSPYRPSATRHKFEYDVALSFAGEDRVYVEQVAERLRAANVNVFYDRYEKAKLWGKNLADHLGEVYGKLSRFVVLFVSQYYPQKSWPEHERQSAQARAIRERKVVLLPARFDDTEIAGLPSTVGYIDLRTTTPGELADLILAKLADEG